MPERIITVRIQGANEVGPAFQAVRAELAALEAQAARTTITPGAAIAGGAVAQAAASREVATAAAGVAAQSAAAEVEVRRLSQAFGFGAAEAQGFETVMARRLLPTIGLVSLNAGTIAAAGVLALGAGFALAARAGIELDATLEQETLRFQNFGMSAGQAAAHVQALFQLGAQTPFTAEQLIQASRTLEVFGRGALDTEANLRLLGDTSAATGADLQALSFWVGRLYADLQAGKPIGEAEQNLRQLAVLTPQASRELEALASQPGKGNEAFAAFARSLQGFTGAMEAQSHTLTGLTSTLSDNLGQLAGIAFAPVFEANKSALEGFNAALSGPEAAQSARDLATALAGVVGAIGDIAAVWNVIPADLRAYLMGGPLSQAVPGIRAAAAAGTAVVGGQSLTAGTVGIRPADEGVFRQRLAERLSTLEAGMMVQFGVEPLNRAALAQRQALLQPTPGGFDIASFERGQGAGFLAPRGGVFEQTFQFGGVRVPSTGAQMGPALKEVADRDRELNEQLQLTIRLTGQVGAAFDEFGRRRGAGPQTFADQLAVARAAALGQTAQDRLAADRAATAGRTAEYERAQQQVGIERELAALESDRLRAKATGSIAASRADEVDIARQQDALATLRLRAQNERELQSAIEAQNAAVVALDQATHDMNQSGIDAASQQIKGWGDQITAIKAAGTAIRDVTDAQQALNARRAQERFDQEQERARGITSNLGIAGEIAAFGRTQAQVQGQREIDRLTRQRDQDQERGNITAVARDEREIERQQNHLKYLQERGQNEEQLFRLSLEHKNAEIDLARAQHDGDVAAAEAIQDKIDLLDTFIRKVREAGKEITEQDPTKKAGGSLLTFGLMPHTTNDPYGIYGGGPGAPPRGQHWDPEWMTFVPNTPTGTRPGDIGKQPTTGQAGTSGDFIYNQTINGDVDRPTVQEIIDAVMGIHRQATVNAIATSGSLVPA